MDWQQLISFLIVGFSLYLIVKSRIKKRNLKKVLPCADECNCAATKLVLSKKSK
jgi:hypothetical protein